MSLRKMDACRENRLVVALLSQFRGTLVTVPGTRATACGPGELHETVGLHLRAPRPSDADRHGAAVRRSRHDVIRRVRLLFRPAAVAVCVGALVDCGEHAAPLHSVGDVQTTFADHGLPLAVVARNAVSTTL